MVVRMCPSALVCTIVFNCLSQHCCLDGSCMVPSCEANMFRICMYRARACTCLRVSAWDHAQVWEHFLPCFVDEPNFCRMILLHRRLLMRLQGGLQPAATEPLVTAKLVVRLCTAVRYVHQNHSSQLLFLVPVSYIIAACTFGQ